MVSPDGEGRGRGEPNLLSLEGSWACLVLDERSEERLSNTQGGGAGEGTPPWRPGKGIPDWGDIPSPGKAAPGVIQRARRKAGLGMSPQSGIPAATAAYHPIKGRGYRGRGAFPSPSYFRERNRVRQARLKLRQVAIWYRSPRGRGTMPNCHLA